MRTPALVAFAISSTLWITACATTTTHASPPPAAPNGDTDGDGLPDVVDKCPQDREDGDRFQDEDGCPDPDNDQDGVLDALDKCPNEPMVRGPKVDASRAQGCPDDLR